MQYDNFVIELDEQEKGIIFLQEHKQRFLKELITIKHQ